MTAQTAETTQSLIIIGACRSCGGSELIPVWSGGDLPLANGFLSESDLMTPDATYPLALVFCPACSLVQITATVSPELLFGQYLYFSSYSEPLLDNARALCERLIRERRLNRRSLVVEIGSNDGYLLKNYVRERIPALGVDPAQNIAALACTRGVPTRTAFFSEALGRQLAAEIGRADVIHANNVLAHVADLNGVAAGVAALLKEDGIASIEVHYVKDLVDGVEFDTIYHEHLCYFSATALQRLFARHDLQLLDVERTVTHGGTLRCFAGKRGVVSGRVADCLYAEEQAGVDGLAYYQRFGARVETQSTRLCGLLADLKGNGKRIIGYGAPAKATMLLNALGIGAETLDYVVDSTPAKQGRVIPGVRLPIYAPDRVRAEMPDYALLLTWNFADLILAREAAYRARGGKFIIPIPEVKIV